MSHGNSSTVDFPGGKIDRTRKFSWPLLCLMGRSKVRQKRNRTIFIHPAHETFHTAFVKIPCRIVGKGETPPPLMFIDFPPFPQLRLKPRSGVRIHLGRDFPPVENTFGCQVVSLFPFSKRIPLMCRF